MNEAIIQRFMSEVAIGDWNECWLWTGPLDKDGYGERFKVAGEKYRPHRVSCEIAFGPSSLFTLHSCENRACCNPAHLRWGTPMDNAVDRERAGHTRRGDAHGNRRLHSSQVAAIRERHRHGEPTRALARAFGVSQTQMRRVVDGIAWKGA